MNYLTKLLAGADNNPDVHKLMMILMTVGMFGLSGYAIYKGQTFSLTDYAMAAGAILGAGGYGIAVVNKSRQTS